MKKVENYCFMLFIFPYPINGKKKFCAIYIPINAVLLSVALQSNQYLELLIFFILAIMVHVCTTWILEGMSVYLCA